MHIVTKTTNLKATDEIIDYLEKRMGQIKKLLTQSDDDIAIIDVEMSKSAHHRRGDVFSVEINFCVGEKCYRATAEKDTLYSAIDEVKDELVSEIKSVKTKKLRSIRKGGAKVKELLKDYLSPRTKSV